MNRSDRHPLGENLDELTTVKKEITGLGVPTLEGGAQAMDDLSRESTVLKKEGIGMGPLPGAGARAEIAKVQEEIAGLGVPTLEEDMSANEDTMSTEEPALSKLPEKPWYKRFWKKAA